MSFFFAGFLDASVNASSDIMTDDVVLSVTGKPTTAGVGTRERCVNLIREVGSVFLVTIQRTDLTLCQ